MFWGCIFHVLSVAILSNFINLSCAFFILPEKNYKNVLYVVVVVLVIVCGALECRCWFAATSKTTL